MIDKYEAMQRTTDWIKNSSVEEFMEFFNRLPRHEVNENNPSLGSVVDCLFDFELLERRDNLCYHIMITDNFVFGAETVSKNIEDFFKNIDLSQYQVFEIDSIGCLAECS